MSNNPFIGRKDAIGVGIEATPGTTVAPQAFQRQLALTLDPKTTVVSNTSALGVVEGQSDSAVTEQWAEGSVNGPISDLTFGYFLLNLLGSVSPAVHAGETTVYDNTFSVLETGVPPSLTFARANPVASRRFGLGTSSDLEIDAKQNDWAQFTATIMAKAGATSSETVAYANEHLFTSKHVAIYIANNVAGLSGSPTELQLKSIKLKLSRKADRFTPLHTADPANFDPEDVMVSGTMVLRYSDSTLEVLGNANTAQAMKIAIVNTDTTVGTSTNPGVVFTLPQVRLAPITLDNNLSQTLSQTINFTGEYNTTAGYMVKAVLTNMQNGYAHA